MWRVLFPVLAGCPVVTDADLDEVRDADGDGFPSPAFGGRDCDDADATVFPGADDLPYDGVDQDCRGDDDFDQDGDGLVEGDDCDDTSASVGGPTEWHVDRDGDGLGGAEVAVRACDPGEGLLADGTDCDDQDPLVGASIVFWPDGDGDGFGVDGDTATGCTAPPFHAPNADDCDDTDPDAHPGVDWYPDDDRDTYGDVTATPAPCAPPDPTWVTDGTDCRDDVAEANPGQPPEADVAGDGVDTDCDGGTELDFDGDGFPDLGGCDTLGPLFEVFAVADLPLAIADATKCAVVLLHEDPLGPYGPVSIDTSIVLAGAPGERPRIVAGPVDTLGIELRDTTGPLVPPPSLTIENLVLDGFEEAIRLAPGADLLGSDVEIRGGAGVRVADAGDLEAALSDLALYDFTFFDGFQAVDVGAGTVLLARALVEDAQTLGDLVTGGSLSTTIVDSVFADDAALGAIVRVPSGLLTLERVTVRDCVGVALDATIAGASTVAGFEVERCASGADHLVRIEGSGVTASVSASDWSVVDNLWSDVLGGSGLLDIDSALVRFDGVDVVLERSVFHGNQLDRVGPNVQVLGRDGVPTTLLVRAVQVSASGQTGIWMDGGRLENVTLTGLELGVYSSGALEIDGGLLVDLGEAVQLAPSFGPGGTTPAATLSWSMRHQAPLPDAGVVEDPTCLPDQDPLFLRYHPELDPAVWDLRLHPSSPLLGAGDPLLPPSHVGAMGGPAAILEEDADGDRMYDSWELRWLDGTAPDGTGDADGDGLSDQEEFDRGTLPIETDTDDDGVTDDADEAPLDPTTP